MLPWLQDADVALYHGDVLATLRELPAESVDCVVTSPPYWGLRDYGTADWTGGTEGCDHIQPVSYKASTLGASTGGRSEETHARSIGAQATPYRHVCAKCGATRIDQQLGLEPTPEQYVERMAEVFREVRRVLAAHGTVWLNLGDSYAAARSYQVRDNKHTEVGNHMASEIPPGLKQKDLVGIPWRIAFALQQPYYAGRIKDERDRLWLAAMIDTEGSICIDILKADKGNRKRDAYSVNVRVHNTSEALVRRCAAIAGVGNIHLHDERRQPVYQWSVYGENAKTVLREIYPHLVAKRQQARIGYGRVDVEGYAALRLLHAGSETSVNPPEPPTLFEPGWYLRSDIIWSKPNPMPESVTDRPTKAHEYVFLLSKQPRYFFDQEAVRENAQWRRCGTQDAGKYNGHPDSKAKMIQALSKEEIQERYGTSRNIRSVWEIATQPYPEAHFATFPEELARRCIAAGCPERGTVLDPFIGSGTVAYVARKLGRHAIGIDLNESYLELAARRLQQQSLFAGAA